MIAEIKEYEERKLVTVRKILNIEPIQDADAIEVLTVDGWKVVTKKGDFKPGDSCLYFEIDSFLPEGNPAWQFLIDKQPCIFNGITGHKLRTIKLRGVISQGLVLSLNNFPEIKSALSNECTKWNKKRIAGEVSEAFDESSIDFSSLLGVVKYDSPLSAQLSGLARGLFPSFIKKTNEVRAQGIVSSIFGYEPKIIPEMKYNIINNNGDKVEYISPAIIIPPKASIDDRYEITLKLDGSSCTLFHYRSKLGVCSKNLELKIEGNEENSFVRMLYNSSLDKILPQFGNIAIQGELMGPGIQKNREKLPYHQLYIFNIQCLDTREYFTPEKRRELFEKFITLGVNQKKVFHIPVISSNTTLLEYGITDINSLINFADGPGMNSSNREGLVFKHINGKFSFKIISNKYLLKNEE